MSKNVIFFGTFAIALMALASSALTTFHSGKAAASTVAKPVFSNGATLPQTKEYTALQTSCQICHSFDMVTTQRLSATTWTAEVTKMIKFGSPLPKSSETAIVAYLAKYLGPTVPRSATTTKATAPPDTLTQAPPL
jgi:hypothetical protein